MKLNVILLGLLGLACPITADPTWPSDIDELEEIMFQLTSFRARKFADTVSPCSNEASGPGRQNAAEWLRTAFHDMSTANTFFGTGGLDASLQYELDNGENTGPGHKTTLEFMSPFMSRKSSLSDLLALGVYMSVRSCNGPVIPIRAGRKDATAKGNTGVPQPQNSAFTFQQQFERMGFSNEEMIQVTACGHTLGGVHSSEFPDLVPDGTTENGEAGLDSTVAVFDNKVVTEYLSGETTNPLVVGPSVRLSKHSDFKVFNIDRNVTMQKLADVDTFRDTCKAVLQKMIDVVPPEVELTEPIAAYKVKPVNLQLTLDNGGSSLQFSGFIRVKTTGLPTGSISSISITYKDRNGGSACGSGSCTLSSTVQGVSQGFDDTFAFYPIEARVPVSSGISSFTVTINHADGAKETFDNNGSEYPLQDAVLLQMPQSCLRGSTGTLTVVAAVHNDRVSQGAKATISYKVPRPGSPIPLLQNATIDLTKGECIGSYTFFSADYTIEGGLAYESRIDVTNGDKEDGFKSVNDIGGTCRAFANPQACNGGSSSTASKTVSSTDSTPTPSTVTSTDDITTSQSMPTSATESSSIASSTVSSISPTATLHHRESMGGYKLVSCWTEGKGARALSGKSFADDDMTLERCMDFCGDYEYWGTEYGRECYCGNSLASSSSEAPLKDCSMVCAGDSTQYCGAGDRLELYRLKSAITASPTSTFVTSTRSTATIDSTTTSNTIESSSFVPSTTATLAHKPNVPPFTLVGCWTEAQGGRALSQGATSNADMTNERCADFCKSYKYFGTEYGGECYCGSYLADSSESAPLDDCHMTCLGDKYQYCGAGNRLELYMNPDAGGGKPEQPAAAGSFVWLGCRTEVSGGRALTGATKADDAMTNAVCADFCEDFEYFGTEYGRECYCGNALPEGSEEAPASECKMTCGGNASEFCGGGNRLSVYMKQGEEELLDNF